MKTLAELEHEEQFLLLLLKENRELRKELHTKEFIEKHGIDIGDEIEHTYGRNTKRGIISRFEYMGYKPYCYIIKQFKKDGSVGKKETRCWWSSNENYFKIIKKA